jgi:hypothetical protein
MVRGDTLFFNNQVYQNLLTNELFTIPVTSPPTTPPANSVPFNLTGAEIWFTAKSSIPLPDVAAVFELNNMTLGGVAILTAASGTFSVTGSPQATLTFPDSRVLLYFDQQVKDSTGRVSTVEVGHLEVFPDTTRNIT